MNPWNGESELGPLQPLVKILKGYSEKIREEKKMTGGKKQSLKESFLSQALSWGKGEKKKLPGEFISTDLPTHGSGIHSNLCGLGKFMPNASGSIKPQGIWQKQRKILTRKMHLQFRLCHTQFYHKKY